jgi:membrane protein implicated in regulation of membrane protease activity
MSTDVILERLGLPLLLTFVCVYFVVKLWVFKDTYSIRNKKTRPLRNEKAEEGYRHDAGWLILGFGIVSAVNAVLSLVSPEAAIIEMIIGFLAVAVLWKNVEEKYSTPSTRSAIQPKAKKNKKKKK